MLSKGMTACILRRRFIGFDGPSRARAKLGDHRRNAVTVPMKRSHARNKISVSIFQIAVDSASRMLNAFAVQCPAAISMYH